MTNSVLYVFSYQYGKNRSIKYFQVENEEEEEKNPLALNLILIREQKKKKTEEKANAFKALIAALLPSGNTR